jgi:predicted O-linked N-acetylglucosamine transferase (SPINDLY family)
MSDARPLPQPSAGLRRAIEAHQAGRLDEAARLYARALQAEPGEALGWYFRAGLEQQRGDLASALAHVRRALEIRPAVAPFQLLLGNLLKARGQLQEATVAYFLVTQMDPGCFDAWNNIGTAYRALGVLPEAETMLRGALKVRPDSADALCNLAAVCLDQGKDGEAVELLQRATQVEPRLPEAWFNLGNALAKLDALEDAEHAFRNAAALAPQLMPVWYNLGNLLCRLERLEDAGTCYQQAVRLAPTHVPSIFNLGNVLQAGQLHDDAIACYREVLRLQPGHALAHFWWGTALNHSGRPTEAVEHYDLAIALDPGMAKAWHMKGGALYNQGRVGEAVGVSLKALDVQRDMPFTFSNSLFMLNYAEDVSMEDLAGRAREYDRRFCADAPRPTRYRNLADPGRRLRIGYLSPDLRSHSVAYFAEPVLAGHDRTRFEVYCYFNWSLHDAATARFKGHAQGWTDCYWMSNEELAERIEADGIDILVDLAGHTAGNRLQLLARKPAPVQITWLGYPSTTGVSAVDYRVSDWHVDPAGYEAHNVERLLRMPHSYYCYRPLAPAPDVAPLPAAQSGHVTFGSFNNIAKVSDATLRAWARVVQAVPGARLLLKAKGLDDPAVRESLIGRLAALGIGGEQLILRGWEKLAGGQLALYAQMDVALDTFPYNGGTTTCEALWMGVPVVTLRGATHASRMGASLLHAAGMPELVANSEDEFVAHAVRLALDLPALARLRAGMRERLAASPLLDEHGFVRALEAHYRDAWRGWCDTQAA